MYKEIAAVLISAFLFITGYTAGCITTGCVVGAFVIGVSVTEDEGEVYAPYEDSEEESSEENNYNYEYDEESYSNIMWVEV